MIASTEMQGILEISRYGGLRYATGTKGLELKSRFNED